MTQNCQIWALINQNKKCIPWLGILLWKCSVSSLHKSILKRVKCHHKLYLASTIFPAYDIPHADVVFPHMGRKNLPQLQWAEHLTKTSAEAEDSSWLKLDLHAPAAHGTAEICAWPWKQAGIKENKCTAFIHCDPYKNLNLRARFWMGGDGGIHWPTVESGGRKHQTCSSNNVFLKVKKVYSSTWDLHFRMSFWLKFVFSNQLSMYICSEVTTTKGNLPFFRANSNCVLGRGGGESGKMCGKLGEIPSGFSGMFGNYLCSREKTAY